MKDWEFEWKGKIISKSGDLFKIIEETKTKKEAHDFLEIASKHTPWVMKDIEYYMGYKSRKEAKKLWNFWKRVNMNAWYRLGVYEAKNGFIGTTPARLSGWIK